MSIRTRGHVPRNRQLTRRRDRSRVGRRRRRSVQDQAPLAPQRFYPAAVAPRKSNRAGGHMQATAGELLGEFERTILGKQKRGTIWSTSCSRSMPVSFPTRAAGYTACKRRGGHPCAELADQGGVYKGRVSRCDAPGRGGRASFPQTSRGQPGPCRRATGRAVPAARREVEAWLVPGCYRALLAGQRERGGAQEYIGLGTWG